MDRGKKTRIGICTFHYAVNPGSTWQAYALYKTIASLGPDLDVRLVNYQETRYRGWMMTFKLKWPPIHIVYQLYKITSYLRYQRFWNCIGGLGKRMDDETIQNLEGYDVIVAGSDQIWNLELTGRNLNFFIPFCKGAKKISYAASIGGKDFPEEDKVVVARYLRNFSHLSVREPEAQVAIEQLIGRKPELVLDPSLLLQKSNYEKIAWKPRVKKDYILLHIVNINSEVIPFARRFAEAKGLQIVECHGHIEKKYKDDKILRRPDPRKWLGYLMNAKYVFTDSFHGCAFCIICHVPFYVRISSANTGMSSRIYNILGRYGLNDRLFEDENAMFALGNIDFSRSDAMLQKDREQSISYLKKALGITES